MKTFGLFDFNLNKDNQSKSRKIKLLVSSLLLIISFTIIEYRTVSLASLKNEEFSKTVHKNTQPKIFQENLRGNIYDRNNKILATTINTFSLNINPQEILNRHDTTTKLLKIFPHLNYKDLSKKLNSNKKHINILREISPIEYVRLLDIGLEGLKIQSRRKRIYPNNTLASHILGGTDIDGKGIAGIEKNLIVNLKRAKT
jgi:Cell division protein FtsI/penicillin-binding protein 2